MKRFWKQILNSVPDLYPDISFKFDNVIFSFTTYKNEDPDLFQFVN